MACLVSSRPSTAAGGRPRPGGGPLRDHRPRSAGRRRRRAGPPGRPGCGPGCRGSPWRCAPVRPAPAPGCVPARPAASGWRPARHPRLAAGTGCATARRAGRRPPPRRRRAGETRGGHDQRAHCQGDEAAGRHPGTFQHGKRATGHDADRDGQRCGGGAGADQGGQAGSHHPDHQDRQPDPRAHPLGGQPGNPRQGSQDAAHQQDQVPAAQPGHGAASQMSASISPAGRRALATSTCASRTSVPPYPRSPVSASGVLAHCPICGTAPSAGRHADGPGVRVRGPSAQR